MSNVVTTLLDFILDLLRDPDAAADYERNPHAAIQNAGLTGVTPADVSSAMGMVSDCSPVRGWEGGVSDYHPSHPYAPRHEYQPHHDHHPHGVEAYHPQPKPEHCHDDDHKHHEDHKPWDDHAQGQEMAVIQHVTHIENDVTITEIDASHSVWVNGDVNLLFGEENVLNTGSGVLLNDVEAEKGGSIDIDNSHVDVDVDLENSLNGSFNQADNGAIAGGSNNSVDNSSDDHSTTTNTNISGNTGDVANNTGGDQHVGDETTIGDIEVKDNQVAVGDGAQASGDGGQNAENGGINADDGAHVVNDSFNPEDSFNHQDVDVNVDDVNLVDTDGGTAVVGNDLEVEHSFNGNDFAGGDIDESHDLLSDNAVAVDQAVAVTDPDVDLGLAG
jgi:hypothetical protein